MPPRSGTMRSLLLMLVVVLAASCTARIDDDKIHKDPEGRNCIKISRAFEIPPLYCPLEKQDPDDASKTVPATEWVKCKVKDIKGKDVEELFYENCPAGATNAAAVRQTLVPCTPAPYFVPMMNEANPSFGPVAWVEAEITGIMGAAAEHMYTQISTNPSFRKIVLALVTMVFAMYSINVMLQLRPPSIYEFVMLVLKVTIIMSFAFNWEPFRDIVFNSFENQGMGSPGAIHQLMMIASDAGSQSASIGGGGNVPGFGGAAVPAGSVYTQLDAILAMVFGWNFQKFMLTLLFAGWGGKLYFLLLLVMIISYLAAAVAVTQAVLIALIGRMFLYALAPLFIMLALLDQTKQLFRNWTELLMSFCLQPIFLGAFLGFFLGLITMMMKTSISTPGGGDYIQLICYAPWQWMKDFFGIFYFWQFANMKGVPAGADGLEIRVPVNLYSIIAIIIMCDLMRGMSKWVTDLAMTMSRGFVSATGTFIGGAETLGHYAKILPAGAIGGFRGALFGNRFSGKGSGGAIWRGGLFRGQNPAEGLFTGAGRAMRSQHGTARKTLGKEFGNFGADL